MLSLNFIKQIDLYILFLVVKAKGIYQLIYNKKKIFLEISIHFKKR